MKIAFCSAVSFGAQGSPGTYKFIEKCNDYYDIVVFAPLNNHNIVFSSSSIPIMPMENLHSEENLEDIINGLHRFNPDIIYIFNFALWHILFSYLKKEFPNKKFILDIKSPLLAVGEKRKDIQEKGNSVFEKLDAIVTLSAHNVPTWIPNCTIDPLVYPLGMDLSLFQGRSVIKRNTCLKFVYIGVLHAKRQLETLVKIFQEFAMRVGKNVSLDFYGTGPEHNNLEKWVSSLPEGKRIKFCGLYPQKELASILPTYDAGIAWVPNDEYNSSPSLTAIEYMAAGLPILASDTKAHRQLEDDGCFIEFFSNTPASLSEVLMRVCRNGFSQERIEQNFEVIKKYDYNTIIKDYFNPFFQKLIKKNVKGNSNQIQKRPCLLYIGPLGFRPGVWETRASYIFPDLFDAIPDQFEIHMLSGRVPEFAKKSLIEFCTQYNITLHEIGPKPENTIPYKYWKTEISFLAKQIKPDIITNIFAPVTLGLAMGQVGREVGSRVILRVAGDEIGSRIPMGIYDNHIEKLDWDMASQTLGFQMADTIIVMSPLEKERVCKDLSKSEWEKVLVCIRGIDVSRFPKTGKDYLLDRVDKFLYVGRKSLEKGFDILENVADSTFSASKQIQFVFAGSFESLKVKNRDYIGWVDNNNLQKTFSESDAFIMTSRSEGFPQVVAEAMATGLPCILPKHLFKNMFKNNREALLTSLDPNEISKAVFELHKDKKLADSLSNQARKFAETKLDKNIWSKIYHDILLGEEKNITDPFSCSMTGTEEKNEFVSKKIKKKHLKMFFLISPEFLSIREAINKLNRLIIEMVKREHLLYLVFPEKQTQIFNTSEKVVLLTYQSPRILKKQIQQISPELFIMAASKKDRLEYYSFVHGTDIPLVMLELFYSDIHDGNWKDSSDEFDSAIVSWEDDIIFSSSALVLRVQRKDTRYLSKFVHPRIQPYPKIILQKNKDTQLETKVDDDLRESYPINNITLPLWEDSNKRMFDSIETSFLKASEYKNKPEQLFWAQLSVEPEQALHTKRMKEKLTQNLKGNE
jgi:glycosyltransferase involved in cell wall biosynthesis